MSLEAGVFLPPSYATDNVYYRYYVISDVSVRLDNLYCRDRFQWPKGMYQKSGSSIDTIVSMAQVSLLQSAYDATDSSVVWAVNLRAL